MSKVIGAMQSNAVEAYWWNTKPNFGDQFTPELLKSYGLTPVHSKVNDSKVISTGSLLHLTNSDYSNHILGSGLIDDRKIDLSKAKVWGVRGELTKERVKGAESAILGDPGLLAKRLLNNKNTNKRYKLGIVPHFVDTNNSSLLKFIAENNKQVKVINVQKDIRDVIAEINSCEHIISSSLHGIIVSDALGVPNAWMKLSDKVIGDGFKFKDYGTSINHNIAPVTFNENSTLASIIDTMTLREIDQSVFEGLDEMFIKFSDHIMKNHK